MEASRRRASQRGPYGLFETGLPMRWYLPADDVRLDCWSGGLANDVSFNAPRSGPDDDVVHFTGYALLNATARRSCSQDHDGR